MDPSGNNIAMRAIIIIILLGLSTFFSSSETALTTINKVRIRTLTEGGGKSARWVMKLPKNQEKMLSTILIGNNVVNPSTSSMLTMLVTEIFGNKAARATISILTLLILVFDEITPKTIAALDAERYSLQVGHMTHILTTVLTPLIVPISWMPLIVLKVLHVDPGKRNDGVAKDELRAIVDVDHEKGITKPKEREMINNVFGLGDSVAKDVMVPRVDMAFVDMEADYDDLVQIFREKHYTRLPVYKETTDDMMGIINIKDLLLVENKASFYVSDYLRQPFYTFESKKLSELVMGIKKSPSNIIIVLDEYGATAGLIALRDILEEIVDDIRDKYDEDEKEELMGLGDGQYLVKGSMKLDGLNDILDLGLSSEDYDSVGGLVIDRLERLPSQGEEAMCGSARLVMEQVEKNRIDKVHLYIPPGEKEEE